MKTKYLLLTIIIFISIIILYTLTTKVFINKIPKENTINTANHVVSRNLEDSSARINILKKYFKLRTDIIDAEFDIYNVNLSVEKARTIPGPTDYRYKVAVLVDKKDVDEWRNDVESVENQTKYDCKEFEKLVVNNKNFKFTSTPIIYEDKNNSADYLKYVIVFEDEGIVYFHLEQH